MTRYVLSVFTPPLAVCRYGCASCCAAPIGVFWIGGIVALVYGTLGGPLQLAGVSWGTVALGVLLWLAATVWAALTVRAMDQDLCESQSSPLCSRVMPEVEEPDPMEEVRHARGSH